METEIPGGSPQLRRGCLRAWPPAVPLPRLPIPFLPLFSCRALRTAVPSPTCRAGRICPIRCGLPWPWWFQACRSPSTRGGPRWQACSLWQQGRVVRQEACVRFLPLV